MKMIMKTVGSICSDRSKCWSSGFFAEHNISLGRQVSYFLSMSWQSDAFFVRYPSRCFDELRSPARGRVLI